MVGLEIVFYNDIEECMYFVFSFEESGMSFIFAFVFFVTKN